MDRRSFLRDTLGSALLATLPAEALGQRTPTPVTPQWDAGRVRHLLPMVSDTRLLLKASFMRRLSGPPTLRVGRTSVLGRMTDTMGECWQFHATGLAPGSAHTMWLGTTDGHALCESWTVQTLPPADAQPEHVRVLCFTCAGGPEGRGLTDGYLPTEVRNRLLRRGLSFEPHFAIANGDHVYWDLHAPRTPAERRDERRLKRFDESALVFGGTNETVLKEAVAPQIVPVYGTDFRSTPVFFLQDDHDYFDNDEGTNELVTLPSSWFRLQLARATQRLYYPEFLPDATRPANLPWTSQDGDRDVSESFGTLRYGRLLEMLLYDVRRTMTLAGPSATFVDPQVERWLLKRTAATEVTHLVHAPSTPPGWTVGNWGEWYPDVLDARGTLTTASPKPFWQPGWLSQHDRLLGAIAAQRGRVPLIVSGDIHAMGIGHIERAGTLDLRSHPVVSVLSGPLGTSPGGWPTQACGVGATPPAHLDVREELKPIEHHGFTIADFYTDRIVIRSFKWDVTTQSPEAIDTLEPSRTTEFRRG